MMLMYHNASQNKSKEGPPLPKRMKKSVPKKLDFSFLQSTFDSVSRKVNTVAPSTSGEQQNIPPEQPGTSKSKGLSNANTTVHMNQGPPGEPSRAAMNNSASNKKDSTDALQRKLDVFRERNNTIQSLRHNTAAEFFKFCSIRRKPGAAVQCS
ncbi:hypothetical protein PIB30_107954, partial [Stylosanthes scabra]|nr:hypothetical protein [Stylosanthes scabra]